MNKKLLFIFILSILMVMMVGCNKDIEEDNEPKEVIKVGDLVIDSEVFHKYIVLQSYDFEKEYGPAGWDFKQDGKTIAETRKEQTIDYLVKAMVIRDYFEKDDSKVDEETIRSAYNKYATSIADNTELRQMYVDNDINEEFLIEFLTYQYYLKMFEDKIFVEYQNDEETNKLIFENQIIRYKSSHILVSDEEKAKEVIAMINDELNPLDFGEAAKIYSEDDLTAFRDGDLGYVLLGTMPKEYEEACLMLEMYVPQGPVHTDLGYHIILINDRQTLDDMMEYGMPDEELESYKNQILSRYVETKVDSKYEEIKNNMNIIINKENIND